VSKGKPGALGGRGKTASSFPTLPKWGERIRKTTTAKENQEEPDEWGNVFGKNNEKERGLMRSGGVIGKNRQGATFLDTKTHNKKGKV